MAGRRDRRSERRVEIEGADPARLADRLKLDDGVGFLVRLVSARSDALFERLTGQAETTPRQFAVLLTLHQSGPLTLTELASAIRVDRSTLGEMVKRMEGRALVRREPHPQDGRAATLTMTPSGSSLLMRLVEGAARLQSELLAAIEPEERAGAIDILKRLAGPP